MSSPFPVEHGEPDRLWASVDLGTNTFRLLIAEEIFPGRLCQRELAQEVVRLGQGLESRPTLLPEAVERAEALLRRFRERMDAWGVGHRIGGLTAAGRRAADGGDFCARAGQLLDARVRILPGEEEARLSAAGALSLIDTAGRDVVFIDIGGGSSEVVSMRDGREEYAVSLPTGVVRLFESLAEESSQGPPAASFLQELDREAARAVAALPRALGAGAWAEGLAEGRAVVVATAGTPLTVAAQVCGKPICDTRALSGVWVTRNELQEVWGVFGTLSTAERRTLASVEPGREDVILAGLALLRAFLDRFQAPGFTVSDGGLLEGLLLDAVAGVRGRGEWEASRGGPVPAPLEAHPVAGAGEFSAGDLGDSERQ